MIVWYVRTLVINFGRHFQLQHHLLRASFAIRRHIERWRWSSRNIISRKSIGWCSADGILNGFWSSTTNSHHQLVSHFIAIGTQSEEYFPFFFLCIWVSIEICIIYLSSGGAMLVSRACTVAIWYLLLSQLRSNVRTAQTANIIYICEFTQAFWKMFWPE